MSSAKIVRAMRDHPQVPLTMWAKLPSSIGDPFAAFPSARRDGSIVIAILERDERDDPVVVPIMWDANQKLNIILSVYGRSPTDKISGDEWIQSQIKQARNDGSIWYEKIGSADAKPKPEPAEATSWSPGSIPVDRPTKPRRQILTIPSKVKVKPVEDT